MSNSTPDGYDYQVVSPTNHAGLTFRFLKPAEFKIADLPEKTLDFSKATEFMPLAVAITPIGPMVFSVGARPAYEDGTAEQWLDFLLREEGYEHTPITETRLGNLPAVTCEGLQKADDLVMKMRFFLLEDGGRIFHVNAMAPEQFWSNALQKFEPMFTSFELRDSRGTKFPLRPGGAVPAAAATAAVEKSLPAEEAKPAVEKSSTARLTQKEVAALALGEDTSSLDPEERMNANLRNNGVGLVPRLVSVDLPSKSARIAAGAVQGTFRIPLGWRAMDDGKRTLVFNGGAGGIQVNLSQRRTEGLSTQDFARGCLNQYLEREPDLPVASLALDSIAGAGVRGAKIDDETLDQYFLVRDLGREGLYLVARVTASGKDATRALDLAGDMMATFEAPDAAAR